MAISIAPRAGMPDWSVGEYEHTAAQLLPTASVVVERARIAADERVVDLGCGTGNATLLIAGQAAHVTGVDPAMRLLDVARHAADERGLEATFLAGEAGAIPICDGCADVIVSVFGVIFAPDPVAAAAEMARVVSDRGRIVLSAWIPEGAISRVGAMMGGAVREALGAPEMPRFAWHERDALAELLREHDFTVDVEEHTHAFTAPSLEAYVEGEFSKHPLGVAGRAVLEQQGEAQELFERAVAMLAEANEDPNGFRLTSRYVVATAHRG
jgi:SAM-dependent methyltransferase